MEKNNKYLVSYLEYLKYQKNYSDYTIQSYQNDIEEELFEIVANRLSMRVDDLWDLYNNYSIYHEGNINASIESINSIVAEVVDSINTANFCRNKTMYE